MTQPAKYEYALTHINARPSNSQAYTYPPNPDLELPNLYRFVLRRRDRFANQAQRVPVSYTRGNALSRDITTEWDGIRAATLFLRDEREVLAAKGMGWREDITEAWFAHLRGEVVNPEDDPDFEPDEDTDDGDGYPDFSVDNDSLEDGEEEFAYAMTVIDSRESLDEHNRQKLEGLAKIYGIEHAESTTDDEIRNGIWDAVEVILAAQVVVDPDELDLDNAKVVDLETGAEVTPPADGSAIPGKDIEFNTDAELGDLAAELATGGDPDPEDDDGTGNDGVVDDGADGGNDNNVDSGGSGDDGGNTGSDTDGDSTTEDKAKPEEGSAVEEAHTAPLTDAVQLEGAAYREDLQRWAKDFDISPKQSGAKLREALAARLNGE